MSITEFVQFRRKRQGRTNYKKRLSYLKSQKSRLVIRKTNKHIILQIIDYDADGDKVRVGVTSRQLSKLGWTYGMKNLPACYLAGLLIAKKAKEKGINEAIVDLGLQSSVAGSRLYAAVKGAIEGGLSIPVDESALPSTDRITGKHIIDYFQKSGTAEFSTFKASKSDLSKLQEDLASIRKKLV